MDYVKRLRVRLGLDRSMQESIQIRLPGRTGCAMPEIANGERNGGFPMLVRLDDTLQPLIEAFNRNPKSRRFVTLLSPT